MKNLKLLEQLAALPDNPGIYLFYNAKKELVYVGKATSLKNRVQSYFRLKKVTRPIEAMMHEVVNIKYQVTDSVLEAVILEANQIKKHLPRYNVLGKDNRSWNYIVITRDEYPEVKTIRQHEYELKKEKQFAYVFGPYPGLNTQAALKILRQMFHFSSCRPGQKRPCLYYQMGQCLGVCVRAVTSKEYKQKVITPLVMFLKGEKKKLIVGLEKKMALVSKQEDFEEAGRLRDQLKSLYRIQDITLINKSMVEMPNVVESEASGGIRIEGYDISNLGATGKVASMVVFDSAGPMKDQYRKFKIKTVEGQSDVDCLEEVIRRRLKHSEWPFPNVFLIDGGRPQVNRVEKVLQELHVMIPVVGIAKGPDRKKNEFTFQKPERAFVKYVNDHQEILIRVRDEAHRFAITFQKSLRKIKRSP
jgi:excinuclease UvrABC nuclease subunit